MFNVDVKVSGWKECCYSRVDCVCVYAEVCLFVCGISLWHIKINSISSIVLTH